MLRWLKFLPGRTGKDDVTSVQHPAPAPQNMPGYHFPQPAAELTATPVRHFHLQQLWDNSALPAEQYQQLYLVPLTQLLLRVQSLPAAPSGPWSASGGYGDMVVRYVTCAVRLAKAHLLPPGATPEEQAAQGVLWNAVVYWSALFYHLPLLRQFTGELRSGKPWYPGISEPGEPYRFRFSSEPSPVNLMQSTTTLMACQLLPPRATGWLSTVPASLDCLAQRLCGHTSSLSVIDELLATAVEKSGAVSMPMPAWSSSLSPETRMTSQTPLSGSEPGASTGGEGSTSTTDIQPIPVVLQSALTSDSKPSPVSAVDEAPVSGSGIVEMVATEPPTPGDDMTALLALLGNEAATPEGKTADVARLPVRYEIPPVLASEPEPRVTGQREEEATSGPVMSELGDILGGALAPGQGEGTAFWGWLRDGVRSGRLKVNGPDDALQVAAGFVLIPVPGMFFRFLKDTGRKGHQRDDVQRAFEQLNHHKRRESRRFYFGRLHPSGNGSGTFTRTKGYLVKASLLFDRVPPDSPYLVIT